MGTFGKVVGALLAASVLASCASEAAEHTVQVRGVTLPVPTDWRVESDPDSTLTMLPSTGSDALRLTVIVGLAPKPVDSTSARRAVLTAAPNAHAPDVHACGATASTFSDDSTREDTHPVFIRRWFVAHASPPDTMRVAVLTYALDAALATTSSGQQKLALVDSIVGRIQFTTTALRLPCTE